MRKGNVVQEMLAQATASRADLVVIGSHGRGGVQSAAANRGVAYAKRLAKEANARLIVMHAIEWPFGSAVKTSDCVGISLRSRRTRNSRPPRCCHRA